MRKLSGIVLFGPLFWSRISSSTVTDGLNPAMRILLGWRLMACQVAYWFQLCEDDLPLPSALLSLHTCSVEGDPRWDTWQDIKHRDTRASNSCNYLNNCAMVVKKILGNAYVCEQLFSVIEVRLSITPGWGCRSRMNSALALNLVQDLTMTG